MPDGRLRGTDFVVVHEGPRVSTLIAKSAYYHAKALPPKSNMDRVDIPSSEDSCLSWGVELSRVLRLGVGVAVKMDGRERGS